MKYPLVQELAAEGISVRLICGWLGFSPQGFYRWQRSPVCERDLSDAHLVNAIVDIHHHPEFGYRLSPTSSKMTGTNARRTGFIAYAGSTGSGRRPRRRAAPLQGPRSGGLRRPG